MPAGATLRLEESTSEDFTALPSSAPSTGLDQAGVLARLDGQVASDGVAIFGDNSLWNADVA